MKKLYHDFAKVYLTFILVAILLPASGLGYGAVAQRVTVNLKNASLEQVLREIKKSSEMYIMYDVGLVKEHKNISISLENVDINSALQQSLKNTGLTFSINDNTILISKMETTPNPVVQQQTKTIEVKGIVLQKDKKPLVGAVVTLLDGRNGAITNGNGEFILKIDGNKKQSIEISFTGYKAKVIEITDSNPKLEIVLEPEVMNVSDVVVTGIFTRKAESFTGSSVTITSKDLKRVGNQNVFQSLKNLDPTLFIMDNLDMGSNPNNLPDMKMRGTSTLPSGDATSFKGNYINKPNQPLFILDGFETTVERVFDLDMNRVESITLLKDASAKALYGSKAANGVVVIETKRISGNKPRISYVGSLDITAPDLTSYDLTNAAEKLEVERMEGVYTNSNSMTGQASFTELYNSRLKLIKEGLDTYWLSKPLRTGIGQKHSLTVEVGDSQAVKGVIDFSYNNVKGVMKGSDRTNISGTTNLSYRVKNVLFKNIMTVVSNNSSDSPYGLFSEYTKLNPYWRAVDPATGDIARWAEPSIAKANPMFDATLGTLYKESYLDFTNNFYAEWNINSAFKLTGRFGASLKRSDSDEFLPYSHSKFANPYVPDEIKLRRGSYELENGKSSNVSGDIYLNFNKSFGKHNIFANVGPKISEYKFNTYKHKAEGFPSNMGADITFARQYATGSRPESDSSLKRELDFLLFGSYSYDDKYLLDVTYRTTASSLYGDKNKWTPGWSIGAGYNVHKESFLKDNDILTQLKIRASIGVTGNQNINSNHSIVTYKYYNAVNYQGMVGAYMADLANEMLGLEQKEDFNVGFDAIIGKTSIRFDYFNALTKNMVTDISISTSSGFDKVKDNLGLVRNRGYEVSIAPTIYQRGRTFFNLYGSATTVKNRVVKLSESLATYNKQQEELAISEGRVKPVLIYKDGVSMDAIWAVRSLGIDPMSGREIYVKRDGTLTYTYSPLDLDNVGDAEPKFRGNIGFNFEYNNFGLSATATFLAGGDMYNNTLVNRVENIDVVYNVDRRVLTGRWKKMGDITEYKTLGYNESTKATSRFVQKRNEFNISSINVYYEFNRDMIKKLKMENLKLSFYMNDVVKFSSIKVERGLDYPFARTMSISLSATF